MFNLLEADTVTQLIADEWNNHNIQTWGKSESEDKSTFSGLRSQWTMHFKCKCFKAIKIWEEKIIGNYIFKLINWWNVDKSIKADK